MTPLLFENNRRFHKLLTDGVDVEYRRPDGTIAGDKVWLIDFSESGSNDWLAVNQSTVIDVGASVGATYASPIQRRPDIVVFINGLPLGVIELKNPADENATIKAAFSQLQTYKHDISGLFPYNEILVISDGLQARAGTLTSNWEWFLPWRTIVGDVVAPRGAPEREVLVKGIFEHTRLLDLIQNFIVFNAQADGSTIAKKMAGYHQFHAVNKAVQCTVQASAVDGDRRAGVVWHTQGSGKSLTMAFYAGKIIRHSAMENPTLVILTDRNDLDNQLFGTFAACQDLLRQTPVQAESREQLRELLHVASGGVVFTTVQKFLPDAGARHALPLLSERRNIVFMADEAHRSHGFKARVVKRSGAPDGSPDKAYLAYGFAKYLRDGLPNATYIGYTGTPVEATDRNTLAVFGDYIDIYDIQRAVEDGATVRIYYEGRLAKLELKPEERPKIDPDFEEVTEGEELTVKEQLKSKWARLEAMVGAERRIALVAQDIVEHFERRLSAMDGKGMIICMSRRICVALYDAIIKLRPEWHHDDDDDEGFLKVVMTGSASDPLDWQPHVRNKPRREAIARCFKDAADPMKLVIVRDMWLTGFDVPCLHTMYLDKPMRGHNLIQAIARVNRVFRDKPGGLVVDYLGLADQFKQALADYTEGDRGETGIPQEEAVAVLMEKYEVAAAMYHGFDYTKFISGTPQERLAVIAAGMEHILALPDGKTRYVQVVAEVSQAFALAVPHERALAVKRSAPGSHGRVSTCRSYFSINITTPRFNLVLRHAERAHGQRKQDNCKRR